MAVVKNLMVRAGGDFSGLKNSMVKAQKDMNAFKQTATRTFAALKVAISALAIGKIIKDSVSDAMVVESAINQIKRIMGESSNAFLKWANTQAIAFNMSKAEAIKYGGVYGNLISGFSKSTGETLKYTQDLLKASAIMASGTGRTMEDVLDRIRSGLLGNTESIEDLGINVNVAMIQSTDAFKKFANGKSWQQLDYNLQQQIRLMAILEQSHKKYGDAVSNTTASLQSQLIAQLNNAKLSLGQAFLPIYQTVLPALTALATKLAYVTGVFSQFMQALFGKAQTATVKTTEAQTGAVDDLGDAYESTAKKASASLAGFDEINQLSTGSGTDAGTSGASTTTTAMDTSATDAAADELDGISANVQAMADKVKKAFKDMSMFVVENKNIIVAALAGLAAAFIAFQIGSNFTTIVAAVKAAFIGLGAVIGAISLPVLLVAAAIGALVAAFVYFYQTNESFRGVVESILNGIASAARGLWINILVPMGAFIANTFVAAWKSLGAAANAFKNDVLSPLATFMAWMWKNVLAPVADVLSKSLSIAFNTVGKVAASFHKNVLIPLSSFFSDTFHPVVTAISTLFGFFWRNVLSPFAAFMASVLTPGFVMVSNTITALWKNALEPVATFVAGAFYNSFDRSFKDIGIAIGVSKGIIIGLSDYVTKVFSGNWSTAWSTIKTSFTDKFGAVGVGIDAAKNKFIDILAYVKGTMSTGWSDAWNGMKTTFSTVFGSLYGIVKTPLNAIIAAVNKIIRGLNSLSIDIPSWVPNGLGGKSFGINISEVPRLAKGGLAYGSTMAVVGDNRMSSSDPEVISPLSELKKYMGSDNSEVVSVMKQVLSAIQSSGGSIYIGETEFGRTAAKAINAAQRAEGKTLLMV